ncbi:MAG: two-component system regulatory protein YycI [Blastocatellia bacterium]
MPKRQLMLFLFLLMIVLPLILPTKPLQANVSQINELPTLKTSQIIPNFDIRENAYLSEQIFNAEFNNIANQRIQKVATLKRKYKDLQLNWPKFKQTPKTLFSYSQALTPPSQDKAEKIINKFLSENQDLYHLTLDKNELKPLNSYQTKHNSTSNFVFQQHYQDLPVFGAYLQVALNKNKQIVWLNSELVPNIDLQTNLSLKISAQEAISFAAENINTNISLMFGELTDPKLVLFPMSLTKQKNKYNQELRPAWQVRLSDKEGNSYLVVVDARKGTVLLRANLTWNLDEQVPSYRVFTSNTPQPNLPFISNNPAFVDRELITTNGDKVASPMGWLDGSFTTRGNNVDAQTDPQGTDSGNGFRPRAENLIFDFPLMLNTVGQEPELFSSASVANLFYWVNFTHDYLYKLGFDETAGNFQLDNFGRGGMGGDRIIAEAQDGSGFNNATFGTSEDGFSGRMQIFLWKTTAPKLDAAYDAEVIIHEYVHGLTTRLVGGPQNVVSLLGTQAAGMGEGWSDWYAMSILSKPTDNPRASYPFASYVVQRFTQGIRRLPYSTDKSINPITFADIDPEQSRFTTNVTAVHSVGEVWCQALWEVRANFIDTYGFEVGKNMIEQLVTDALKLTPINPSMIDGRDAILLADQINNDGANQCLIWQGFAARGLGFSSSSLGGTSQVKQSFDLPAYCEKTGIVSLDRPTYLDGENIQIRLGDRDLVEQTQVNVVISSQKTGDQEQIALTKDDSIAGQFLGSIKISFATSNIASDGILQSSVGDTIQVIYQDASNQQGQSAQAIVTTRTVKLKTLLFDTLENGIGNFVPDNKWKLTTTFSNSPTRSWTDSPKGNYKNRANSILKVKKVNLTGLLGAKLVFWQRYQIERGFDFGFVEVKPGKQPWQTIAAFTGEQLDFQKTTIDLSKFDGQKLAVRFRLATDGGTTADGWYIDDIEILSGTTE